MSFFFGLIMFICIVPAMYICYALVYPKNWKAKKMVFGVKNRKEYKEGETKGEIDQIVTRYRKWAFYIVIASTVISVVLLFMKGLVLQTTIWTIFIMLAMLAVNIPYVLGNKDMKALKHRLGLVTEPGVNLVDLTNAGAVHALKPVSIWLPNICGAVLTLIALLMDLQVIRIGDNRAAGSFLMTITTASFWICSMLLLVLAYVFDNLKNEVISADSTVNANYNRARKKNMADFFVQFSWGNFVYMLSVLAAFVFLKSNSVLLIAVGAFMILIFLAMVLFVAKEKKIEARYEKDMTMLEDDDDLWIAGLFYYNPKDKRLNVEKRVGVGGTVNLAHPGGKVVMAILVLSIVLTVLSLVWMGQMEGTPIRLITEDGKLICHQLRDEYVIPFDEIASAEFGEDITEHSVMRISGVGMDNLLKGNFSVDNDNCKVFLAPEGKAYIRLTTTDGQVYYVSGATAEETKAAYAALGK